MIVIIDNYDSFTFNLYQLIESLGYHCRVIRNDAITVEELKNLKPSHLIISPGPGRPEESGICLEAIKAFAGIIPVLGICLGHQAIGMVFGAKVVRAPLAFHGKCSSITHQGKDLFRNIPQGTLVTRYHSLMVTNLPDALIETATTSDKIIMGMRHRDHKIYGLQFHPESYSTELGTVMMKNFFEEAAA